MEAEMAKTNAETTFRAKAPAIMAKLTIAAPDLD